MPLFSREEILGGPPKPKEDKNAALKRKNDLDAVAKERKSRWEREKEAKAKQEEEEKASSPNAVGQWFVNLFSFCGTTTGGGCCGGDNDPPVNQAEEMQWNGINKLEPKSKV